MNAFTLAEIQERRRVLRECSPVLRRSSPQGPAGHCSPDARPGSSGVDGAPTLTAAGAPSSIDRSAL